MNRHRVKSFDCVEMKRRIQENMYEQTSDMTPTQLLAYIRNRAANSGFPAATPPQKASALGAEDDQHERPAHCSRASGEAVLARVSDSEPEPLDRIE